MHSSTSTEKGNTRHIFILVSVFGIYQFRIKRQKIGVVWPFGDQEFTQSMQSSKYWECLGTRLVIQQLRVHPATLWHICLQTPTRSADELSLRSGPVVIPQIIHTIGRWQMLFPSKRTPKTTNLLCSGLWGLLISFFELVSRDCQPPLPLLLSLSFRLKVTMVTAINRLWSP